MANFRDVVSVQSSSRIFVAVQKKLIDRDKSRAPSWLFHCHRSRAHNVKKAAACELIGAKKKGAIFSLRWLDTVCQGQYLPSLSVNYDAINKDLEKLTPQLY